MEIFVALDLLAPTCLHPVLRYGAKRVVQIDSRYRNGDESRKAKRPTRMIG
jgi:hypothetical protein